MGIAVLSHNVGWAVPKPTPKVKSNAGRFLPFRPLSLDELYAKRMRFTAGEPIISVGVMDAQRQVELGADGPARMMFDESGLPKTVYAPPATRFTLKPLSGRPARLRYWAVVQTVPYGQVEEAAAAEARWRKKGYQAKVFEVGSIVALRGNVLDTRERRVSIGGFKRKRRASKLIAKLFAEQGLRPFIHEELISRPSGVIGVYDDRGRLLHRAQDAVYFGTVQGGMIEIQDVEHSRGYRWHGRETRSFWGNIYVVVDRNKKLAVVNSAGAEVLLKGLVPSEIFATAPIEALKAQAVTARGEIFSKLGHRHFGEPFHLCTAQHCQVYAGAGKERTQTSRAVEKTRGLLAVRPRKDQKAPLSLVDSVYSSTCGGFSENNEIVWDNVASDSLRSKLDGTPGDPALKRFAKGLNEENVRAWVEAYPPTSCARSTFVRKDKFRWKRTFYRDRLRRHLKGLKIGALKDVKVLGRGPGGRVKGLRLIGTQGQHDVVRELPVRRLFGMLNSGMFVLDIAKDADGLVKALTFTGGGWGHGVGMCQVGAIGRAEQNQSFEQILAHYYNGAVVVGIY